MDPNKFAEDKKRAEQCFKDKHFATAKEAYEGLRSYGDDDPAILMRLGDISVELGDTSMAVEDYKKAAEVYARHDSTIMVIAVGNKLLSVMPSRELVEETMKPYFEMLNSAARSESQSSTPPATELLDLSSLFTEIEEVDAEDDDYSEIEVIEYIGDCHFDDDDDDKAESDWLQRAPLFSGLNSKELMGVAGRLKTRSFGPGEYIFKRKDSGDAIFVVISGKAEETGYTKYDEEIKCSFLSEGDCFGEIEYFSALKRKTDVRAITDMELLEIDREEMVELSEEYPTVGRALFDFYKERIIDKSIALSKVFKHLSTEDRRELLKHVNIVTVTSGTEIIKEGDAGNTMYLIVNGSAEVWRDDGNGNKKALIRLGESDYFGEVAVMLDRKRISSVTALTYMDMVVIDRRIIKAMLPKYPVVREVLENVAGKHVS